MMNSEMNCRDGQPTAEVQELQRLIDQSKRIVFFGGAGVSTESGIPDFRGTDGLYNQKYDYPPEVILSHTFYEHYPEEFFRFYRDKMIYPDARPNAAHRKLAELEDSGRLSAVITQNIDGLHQKAGSRKVLELHGSVLRNYCGRCGKSYDELYMLNSQGVPTCSCGGRINPDVVLYEESLDSMILKEAMSQLAAADLLIIGGTSLAVYPAAGLIDYFNGRNLVLINQSATPQDNRASLLIKESIGNALGQIRVPGRQ